MKLQGLRVLALLPLSFGLTSLSGCLSQGQIDALSECAQSSGPCDTGEDFSSTTTLKGKTSYQLRGSTSAAYPFIEYIPGGYDDSPSKRWPLIIMLHGIGEEGQGTTQSDLARAGVNGPNKLIASGREFPAVILTPMAPAWWDNTLLKNFLDYALAAYRIDPRRVYITGLSMGGAGVWGLGGVAASKIAAIVPIAGAAGADSTAAQNLLNANVSIWAFHNQDDGTVAISTTDGWMNTFGSKLGALNQVRADNPTGNPTQTAHLNASHRWEWLNDVNYKMANGTPYPRELHYTVYPSGGHDSWSKTYSNPLFWTWLFQQIRD